jgi:hypothetical protein
LWIRTRSEGRERHAIANLPIRCPKQLTRIRTAAIELSSDATGLRPALSNMEHGVFHERLLFQRPVTVTLIKSLLRIDQILPRATGDRHRRIKTTLSGRISQPDR